MLRTITVGQLRRLLEGEDDDALVIFTANYGDYHNTMQALPLNGTIDQATVTESAYSNSGYAIDKDELDEETDEQTYLVIR